MANGNVCLVLAFFISSVRCKIFSCGLRDDSMEMEKKYNSNDSCKSGTFFLSHAKKKLNTRNYFPQHVQYTNTIDSDMQSREGDSK